MKSETEPFQIENAGGRQKITIPLILNWLLLALFSFVLLIWAAMILVVIVYLVRGLSSSFVLTAILLLWLLVWLFFGRYLWKRWQFHASTREILFIDKEQLILRRPVSLLGITTSYDIQHVSRFYYSEKHQCAAFDYAYLHVYFGRSLSEEEADQLIRVINEHLYPETVNAETKQAST